MGREYFWRMNTLFRVLAVISVSWLISPPASAEGVATLSGIVKDAKGQPVRGAEIRIVGSDASKIGKVHTDANGHYSYPQLETGTYSITLVVDGATKASISNVKTNLDEIQTLNFDFQSNAAARPFTPGKHYVWIPSVTGSHLGSWVEVSDAKPISSGMQERMANQGNAMIREMTDQHPPGNRHP
jgi:hypothetical protein